MKNEQLIALMELNERLIKKASEASPLEKRIKEYRDENPDDIDGDDFEFIMTEDADQAYEDGITAGRIILARQMCMLLRLDYELPDGYEECEELGE